MADRTIREIKKIEEEIHMVLQVLRNEIETIAIIKEHAFFKGMTHEKDAKIMIQDELEESVGSIEELINLHKNLDEQINKLDGLLHDLLATKS